MVLGGMESHRHETHWVCCSEWFPVAPVFRAVVAMTKLVPRSYRVNPDLRRRHSRWSVSRWRKLVEVSLPSSTLANCVPPGGKLKGLNPKRAIHYERNDWAAGEYRERIASVLPVLASSGINSINDAIEAHQSKLTVEDIPELFSSDDLPALQRNAISAFVNACRYVNTFLDKKSIGELYDQVEWQYADQFWELLESCGADKHVDGENLTALLVEHPRCLGAALGIPKFVSHFDRDIRKAIMEVPRASAELIIQGLAMDSRRR